MVHISRQERNTILYAILMDGVICCKKEFEGRHPAIKVDNLKVWMLTRSLKSRGYLEETFSWRHHYFTLNQNGVLYIKQVLGINEAKVQPRTRIVRAEEEPREEEEERAPRREERGPSRGFERREGGRPAFHRGSGRRPLEQPAQA